MGIDKVLSDNRQAILDIAARRGARNVRVFGSVARGEADDASDLDLLVDMAPGRSLLDLSGLLLDLRALLGCEIDLVTEASLNRLLRGRILREARPL